MSSKGKAFLERLRRRLPGQCRDHPQTSYHGKCPFSVVGSTWSHHSTGLGLLSLSLSIQGSLVSAIKGIFLL